MKTPTNRTLRDLTPSGGPKKHAKTMAVLRRITPNEHVSWDDFVSTFRAGEREGAWFSVEVGAYDGLPGGEWFQVFVCTRAGEAELTKRRGHSRFVVTPVFSPEDVLAVLNEHLSRISGKSWFEVREKLRKSMWWERETIET